MYKMFFLARNFVCGVDSLDTKLKIHKYFQRPKNNLKLKNYF